MTAFPEYTKRDIERACERGAPIDAERLSDAQHRLAKLRANPPCDFGISANYAALKIWKWKRNVEVIQALAQRLSKAEVCVLIPVEFEAIKEWLPVARIKL